MYSHADTLRSNELMMLNKTIQLLDGKEGLQWFVNAGTLLGLYREDGELQMVGGAASFTAKARLALLADLEPLRIGDDLRDGEPSRWNSAADKRWVPVRPERVCEVAYDQMEGNSQHGLRFRHAVKFLRWRPDRDPSSCTFDQLDVPLNYDLYDVLEK